MRFDSIMTPTDHQEAAQLYQRAEELKGNLSGAISRKRNLFLDPEAWSLHQEFQSLCQRMLLQDLEYSLNKKIENDLWSVCFKDYITLLQTTARDRSPLNKKKATEAQTILNCILDTASGFYIVMLEQFRAKFNLDLPFLRCSKLQQNFSHICGSQSKTISTVRLLNFQVPSMAYPAANLPSLLALPNLPTMP